MVGALRLIGKRASLFACALGIAACGTRLPVPTTGPHPASSTTYVDIPFPPPPARVEVVPPPPPDPGAVWVDGEWAWQGKHWNWQPGGWVLPPAGAYFAPWLVYRLDDGRLLFAPGAWHAKTGERLQNPVVLDVARNGLQEDTPAPAEPPAAPGKAP